MDDSPSLDQLESPSWPIETSRSQPSATFGNFVNEDSAPPLCLDLGNGDNNWATKVRFNESKLILAFFFQGKF